MKEFAYWLLCGADFSLFIFSFVLIIKQKEQRFCRRLLGFVFLILGWYLFMSLLVLSGTLAQYPYLFRTGVPFYYLAAPLLYIYVRSRDSGETSFRKHDWVHFLPTIFALIDLFPFYFLADQSIKRAEIIQYMHDPMMVVSIGRGILPTAVHYYARMVLGLVYIFIQWWILFGRSSDRRKFDSLNNVKVISILIGLMYLGNSIISFEMLQHAGWFDFDHIASFDDAVVLFTCACIVSLSLYLFSSPSILYGTSSLSVSISSQDRLEVKNVQANESHVNSANETRSAFNTEFSNELVLRLEEHMESTEAYRRKGITVYDIAKDLDVAPTLLSSLLNKFYDQRFNDFINRYRIDYVTRKLKSDDGWRKLSIEGLAEDAGFSSRTPFYTAFKKYTGVTPSVYIKFSERAM